MIFRPTKDDYIDFHSHHQEHEKGVFRIFNQLISNQGDSNFYGPQSIGLHPWDIEDFNFPEKLDHILEEKIEDDFVLMVGECGLDKNILTSISKQEEIFLKHIELSEKFSKPLVIHCVKAHQELMSVKKELNPRQKWIIHGFNGSPQLAGDFVSKGFLISIGHSLLLNPEKANEVLNRIPIKNLFIETDESDDSIRELFAKAARHLKMDKGELRIKIYDNFIELFDNDK